MTNAYINPFNANISAHVLLVFYLKRCALQNEV
jgi:hypothetical protein